MPLSFVGPSYQLSNRKADIQRSVNLFLMGMETPGKAPFILESIPGLSVFATLGAEIRGVIELNGRAFAVAGSNCYEFFSDGTSTLRGTLSTTTGPVGMEIGLFHLVIVDGPYGYAMTLATNVYAQIVSAGFSGSYGIAYLNNFYIVIRPGTAEFDVSGADDPFTWDPLDIGRTDASGDNAISLVSDHEELWIMNQVSTEIFAPTTGTGANIIFTKRLGASLEIGLAAVDSLKKIDSSLFWIGQDRNGTGIVYRAQVYQPLRISDQFVEQMLRTSTNLAGARAYVYQEGGLTFYCINAPGLDTTLCYEVSSGKWSDRADLDVDGSFKQHRGTCHVFAFGFNLLGADDGKLYKIDKTLYQNAGDPLVRERVSPHTAAPMRKSISFDEGFYLDCTTGEAGQGIDPHVELSYSNDSGATWTNPAQRTVGKVGERLGRVKWSRCGRSRDRVWKADLRWVACVCLACIH
jgi:hypothetical protein